MKWIKRFLMLALVALVVMQFIRPDKNEGGYESLATFLAETKPTPAVEATLQSACYDCHSNQTNYPWYNNIAPVSYWLDEHIIDGKKHLNFAEWDTYSVKRKDHKLEEVAEEVEKGEMPLDEYTWTHGDAKLSDQQVKELIQWVSAARLQYGPQLQAQ